MHWQLKQKCWLGLKDCNDAHDDNASGTSKDEISGIGDTSRDDSGGVGDTRGYDTSGVGDTRWDDIGGVGDVDGVVIGCDDRGSIGDDDGVVTCCNDLGAIGDNDGVVACCDDPKGAYDDVQGAISKEKPPNYEPCSMITFVNDSTAWRVYKSIDSFTIDGSTTWGIFFMMYISSHFLVPPYEPQVYPT